MGKFSQFKSGHALTTTTKLPETSSQGGLKKLFNRYRPTAKSAPRTCRFAFCLDATFSMDALIENAKRHIADIIKRVKQQTNHDLQIQILAYRNYNAACSFEISEESSDANYLAQWLNQLQVDGGGMGEFYAEAIEIPLQYCHDKINFDAVLVFGDAAAHSANDLRRLKKEGEDAGSIAKHLLHRGGIVHSFHVPGGLEEQHAKQNFAQLAASGGGVAGILDGTDSMIHMAVTAILERINGAQAVTQYLMQYQPDGESRLFAEKLISLDYKQ